MKKTIQSKMYLLAIFLVGAILFSPSIQSQEAGTLDTSFSVDGIFRLEGLHLTFSGSTSARLQSNGKIVVVGHTNSIGILGDLAVARLLSNGTLDATFGTDGIVEIVEPRVSSGHTISMLGDDKFYVGSENYLYRFHSDGELDASFSSDGRVDESVIQMERVVQILIQPDRRIVVVGNREISREPAGTRLLFALARLNEDGTLDSSFGEGGVVSTVLLGARLNSSAPISADLQSDGKIVVGGLEGALARYLPNGSLDVSFGTGGIRIHDSESGINEVISLPDGKALTAVGSVITKLNSDGSIDASFGDAGQLTTPNTTSTAGLALSESGKILMLARGRLPEATISSVLVARFNTDGELDPSFGNSGESFIDDFIMMRLSNDILVQPDGKIIVLSSPPDSSSSFYAGIARLHGDSQTGADISIVTHGQYRGGRVVFYSIVTNHGAEVAEEVVLTNSYPSDITILNSLPEGLSCTMSSVMTCLLGDMDVGAQRRISFSGMAPSGDYEIQMQATSRMEDPILSNNSDSVSISIPAKTRKSLKKKFKKRKKFEKKKGKKNKRSHRGKRGK